MYTIEAAPFSSQNSAPTPETKATSYSEHPIILSEELTDQPHGLCCVPIAGLPQ